MVVFCPSETVLFTEGIAKDSQETKYPVGVVPVPGACQATITDDVQLVAAVATTFVGGDTGTAGTG